MIDFSKKPEILFIDYNEVIKNPYPFLLKKMRDELREYYEPFIDFTNIDNLDDNNLIRFCLHRKYKNILQVLSKHPFDYNSALNDLFYRYKDMYKESPFMSIGNSLHMMTIQKFVEKIYIYTEEPDERVYMDLAVNKFNLAKVKYITGSFFEIAQSVKDITTYILKDIMDVSTLVALDNLRYKNILIAKYGYNFYKDNSNNYVLRFDPSDLTESKLFKFIGFMPIELTDKYFTDL